MQKSSFTPASDYEKMKIHTVVPRFLQGQREFGKSKVTSSSTSRTFSLCKVFPFLSTQLLKSCSNLKSPHILKWFCQEKVTGHFAFLVIILVIINHGGPGSCHTFMDPLCWNEAPTWGASILPDRTGKIKIV